MDAHSPFSFSNKPCNRKFLTINFYVSILCEWIPKLQMFVLDLWSLHGGTSCGGLKNPERKTSPFLFVHKKAPKCIRSPLIYLNIHHLFRSCKRNAFNEIFVEETVDKQRRQCKYHRCSHNVIPVADILPFERVQPDRQSKHRFIGQNDERF